MLKTMTILDAILGFSKPVGYMPFSAGLTDIVSWGDYYLARIFSLESVTACVLYLYVKEVITLIPILSLEDVLYWYWHCLLGMLLSGTDTVYLVYGYIFTDLKDVTTFVLTLSFQDVTSFLLLLSLEGVNPFVLTLNPKDVTTLTQTLSLEEVTA